MHRVHSGEPHRASAGSSKGGAPRAPARLSLHRGCESRQDSGRCRRGFVPAGAIRAWTDPDELAAWYGPEQFDTPREKVRIDLRVGGRYELTMVRRGGGAQFVIRYEILELIEPELIVLRSDPMPEVGMHEPTLARVEFHDHGTKTRVTLSAGPYPPVGRGGAEDGYNAAFDKLATHLTG